MRHNASCGSLLLRLYCSVCGFAPQGSMFSLTSTLTTVTMPLQITSPCPTTHAVCRLPTCSPAPQAMDKSADFRGPFELPGTRLFADFCREVVRRYCLDEPGVVQQGRVSDEYRTNLV